MFDLFEYSQVEDVIDLVFHFVANGIETEHQSEDELVFD
jgi:hypothetical protein